MFGRRCTGVSCAAMVTRYEPAPDRYEHMAYRRCGRSGLDAAGGVARAVAQLRPRPPARHERRDRAPRVRPRHHPLRPREQLRPALRRRRGELRRGCCARTCGRTATSSSSRRRPATTCGPARTASGARASTCSRASTRASAGSGSTTSTSSTRTGSTRTTPLEETMGALATAVQQGKALYAGHLVLLRREHAPRRPRSCASMGVPLLIHQPSYSMFNRWIEAELSTPSSERGHRLHRLLAARPGDADRPLPGRDPGGLAGEPRRLALARPAHRADDGEGAGAERDRHRPRPDASRRWRSPGRCATRASPRR